MKKNCFLGLLIFTAMISSSFTAFAESAVEKTVKVGYYESHSFMEGAGENEIKGGYCYDYLQVISYYTGWKYEYVYGNLEELYQKFLKGEIDFLPGIMRDETRIDTFLYPDLEMGTATYYLYKHDSDNSIISHNIKTLNGKKIGLVKNSISTKAFERWQKERGITVKAVYYNSSQECANAFFAKKVDGIVATLSTFYNNSKALPEIRISEIPYFLAVAKNRPDLLDELNFAVADINKSNPFFSKNLLHKYLIRPVVYDQLSQSEIEWFKEHPTLRIGLLDDYLPYCDIDENGEVSGILVDVITKILSAFKLENQVSVKYTAFVNYNKMLEKLNSGELDLIFPSAGGLYFSEKAGVCQSVPVITSGMNLVFKGAFSENKTDRIAVNVNNQMQYHYVQRNFRNSEIMEFDSIEECLYAINIGLADSTVINGLRVNSILKNSEYNKLDQIQLPNADLRCFGIDFENKNLLFFVNKGINLLNKDKLLNYSYEYAYKLYKYDFIDFIKMYFVQIIFIILAVFGIIIYLIIKNYSKTQRQLSERLRFKQEIDAAHAETKCANEEIQLSETIYKAVRKIVKIGIWRIFFNAEGKLENMEWSQELIHMLGYDDNDKIPENFDELKEFIHPDDVEAQIEAFKNILYNISGANSYDVEYRFLTKKQGYRWFRSAGDVIRREDGSPYCIFGIFMDMTDQKTHDELEKARDDALNQAYKALVAMNYVHKTLGSGQWYVFFNNQSNFNKIEFSDSFRNLLGYASVAEFKDSVNEVSSRFHPDDVEAVKAAFMETVHDKSGETTFNAEFRMLTKDRGYRWFRSAGRISRRDDGSADTFYGLFMDIDESRKKSERLKEALKDAEQANRAKTVFLSNMSHDIRTPMNAIIGFSSLAQNHIGDQEAVSVYLKKISVSSQHLLSLINDVLDMSRIESGRINVQEDDISLSEIVSDIQTIIQTSAQEKQLDFEIDTSEMNYDCIISDKLKIDQILINILGNSIKFTKKGGKISLRVAQRLDKAVDYKDKNFVHCDFIIKDTGIGMSEEFQQHIFEAFSREQSSTVSGIQGTGLGMSITKHLVDMMGGEISVQSEINKGSEFKVSITVRQGDEEKIKNKKTIEKVDFTGKRVLIVEDNELNQEIAEEILSSIGFETEIVDDGDVAVKKVTDALKNGSQLWDIILMDIQMPRVNGYDATLKIRSIDNDYCSNVPIVAMTANAFEEDRQNAYASGMNGHIAKPINMKELTQTLTRVLNEK